MPSPGTLTRSHALSPCQHQEECRSVKHVLFSAWPDHQTPESAGPLLRLVAEVEDSLEPAASARPIVIHCRYAPRPHPASPRRALSRAGPAGPVLTWTGVSGAAGTPSPPFGQPLALWAARQAPSGAGRMSGAPHVLGQGEAWPLLTGISQFTRRLLEPCCRQARCKVLSVTRTRGF